MYNFSSGRQIKAGLEDYNNIISIYIRSLLNAFINLLGWCLKGMLCTNEPSRL